jgi:carboxymethylenebutenolidase
MALDDYLADEIALDHREGMLSRREALRLLGLMGVSVSASALLLDGAASAAAKTTKKRETTKNRTVAKTSTTRAPTTTVAAATVTNTTAATAKQLAGTGPALATSAIRFSGVAGELRATYAAPAQPRGAVLIIHENRGLTDHFKALPGRFARDGYAALALDLASRAGGTDAVAAQMPAPLSQASTADLVADMRSALDELVRRAPGVKLAMIGFCFGGGMVWNLLAAGEPRLAAAAPFYGTGPSDADFAKSPNTAVLAVYAEKDSRVLANRPPMEAALKAAKSTYEVRVFPGVDHAFFNDTGARYDAPQASAAYEAVLGWFGKHLA